MTDLEKITILSIDEDHQRAAFDCGIEALNKYLKRYARQNHEKSIARTFVALDRERRILGFYSLASASIEFKSLSARYTQGLPRYPVPAVRIACLAVDRSIQGGGLGGHLLVDALRRILLVSQEIGIKVVLVDAKNDAAQKFYRYYGFIPLDDEPMTPFLPVETIYEAGGR